VPKQSQKRNYLTNKQRMNYKNDVADHKNGDKREGAREREGATGGERAG